MSRLPHRLYINRQTIGMMNKESVRIEMPPGSYEITIQSSIPILLARQQVVINEGADTHLEFSSRERMWDILFSIDILLSIAKIFFTFPSPWDTIYSILTNGFFVVWLIYEYSIRNRYFHLTTYQTVAKK